jgi:hypothetical protein
LINIIAIAQQIVAIILHGMLLIYFTLQADEFRLSLK